MIEGLEPIRERVESASVGERGTGEEENEGWRERNWVMREITREECDKARR